MPNKQPNRVTIDLKTAHKKQRFFIWHVSKLIKDILDLTDRNYQKVVKFVKELLEEQNGR